ncbi:hypothetical protein ACLOJK_016155 [Asimina triloba]
MDFVSSSKWGPIVACSTHSDMGLVRNSHFFFLPFPSFLPSCLLRQSDLNALVLPPSPLSRRRPFVRHPPQCRCNLALTSLSVRCPSPSSTLSMPRPPLLPLLPLPLPSFLASGSSFSALASLPSPSTAVILSISLSLAPSSLPSPSAVSSLFSSSLSDLPPQLSSIFRPLQRLIRQSYSPPSFILLCDGDFPRPSLEYRSPLFPPPLFATMVSLAYLSPLLPTPHRQPPASLPRCQPCFPPLLFI